MRLPRVTRLRRCASASGRALAELVQFGQQPAQLEAVERGAGEGRKHRPHVRFGLGKELPRGLVGVNDAAIGRGHDGDGRRIVEADCAWTALMPVSRMIERERAMAPISSPLAAGRKSRYLARPPPSCPMMPVMPRERLGDLPINDPGDKQHQKQGAGDPKRKRYHQRLHRAPHSSPGDSGRRGKAPIWSPATAQAATDSAANILNGSPRGSLFPVISLRHRAAKRALPASAGRDYNALLLLFIAADDFECRGDARDEQQRRHHLRPDPQRFADSNHRKLAPPEVAACPSGNSFECAR